MKKFFKTIFSRLILVGLAIILQVLFLVAVLVFFEQYFLLFQAITAVAAMILVINITNRDMIPDGKLPWIVVVAILPVFGVIIYMMFSKNVISYHHRKLYDKIANETAEAIMPDLEEQESIRAEMHEYGGQAEYLLRAAASPAARDTETVYYPSGESFWEALKEALRSAEKFIFLEYFIIERGVMWYAVEEILREKVKAGVEVRLMYDDVGSISKIPSSFYKQMQAIGINCVRFNPFRPIATAVHNNRDHRKIAVIDGIVGFVGGINLADEYINVVTRFGHWKDTAVGLKGRGVANLTLMFLQSFDVMANKTEEFEPYIEDIVFPVYQNNGCVVPFGDGPRPLYYDQVGEDIIVNIVDTAKKYVYITTPYLIPDFRLRKSLQNAAQRGVDVRILTPHIPDKKLIFNVTRSNYQLLMDVGVKIYEYEPGFLHAKSIIADDKVGMVSTINLDYRSLVHHYECGVYMYETAALKNLYKDIEETIDLSILQDENTSKLNVWQRFVCRIIAIFTPLM